MFDGGGFYLMCCGIMFLFGLGMMAGTLIVLKETRFHQIGKWMLAGGIVAGVAGLLYGFWIMFFEVLTPDDVSSVSTFFLGVVYALILGASFFVSSYGVGAAVGCLIGSFGRLVSRLLSSL